MPKNRMPRRLVALSASAVAAVYLAGYLRTQAADSAIGLASGPSLLATAIPTASVGAAVVAAAPPATATTGPQVVVVRPTPVSTVASIPPTATPPPNGASAAQAQLKDGTYGGQGTSRRGDVWVSVQVQGGRIANVSITRSTLQYPLRDIASLPAEVVQRQSAQVDIVSRATYSSMAFRGAVAQALDSARA